MSSIVIDPFAFSPVASPKDTNTLVAIGKPNRHHAAPGHAQTKETVFIDAVIEIGEDKPVRIREGVFGLVKTDSVFGLLMRSFASLHSNVGGASSDSIYNTI